MPLRSNNLDLVVLDNSLYLKLGCGQNTQNQNIIHKFLLNRISVENRNNGFVYKEVESSMSKSTAKFLLEVFVGGGASIVGLYLKVLPVCL